MPQAATSVDAETIERASPPGDRAEIDAELAAFLAGARARFAANPHARPIYDRAAEFVLDGGKRLRPRLALAAYRIMAGSGEDPPRSVRRAAASLELFHAFMLAHDDLIDDSLTRRDRPTLHEAIRRDAVRDGVCGGVKRAEDLAMVAGDLLCALGMRLLGRSGLRGAMMARAHRQVADMLLETGVGEALDVLYGDCPPADITEPQIVDAYIRKTARYSVSGPMVMGATLAGSGRESRRALGRFGDLLGLSYQMQNDLDALDGADPRHECPDLDGGKRTWILWSAYHALGEPGKARMGAALALAPGAVKRSELLRCIEASGAPGACRARVAELRREAVAVLRDSPLDEGQMRGFLGLVSLFVTEPAEC